MMRHITLLVYTSCVCKSIKNRQQSKNFYFCLNMQYATLKLRNATLQIRDGNKGTREVLSPRTHMSECFRLFCFLMYGKEKSYVLMPVGVSRIEKPIVRFRILFRKTKRYLLWRFFITRQFCRKAFPDLECLSPVLIKA